MPSSPTQRGVEGKLVDDEVIADALVVEADDGVEANACDVETPDEGVDKFCNESAPHATEVRVCVEIPVGVQSSSDSDSPDISNKRGLEN